MPIHPDPDPGTAPACIYPLSYSGTHPIYIFDIYYPCTPAPAGNQLQLRHGSIDRASPTYLDG